MHVGFRKSSDVAALRVSGAALIEFHLLCCTVSDGVRIESPFHTVDFLDDFHKILESKFTANTSEQCMDSAGI